MSDTGVGAVGVQSARMAPHECGADAARPADTSPEAWHRLTEVWSSMTPAQRASLAASMSMAVATAARAGIQADEPHASVSRIRFLLAERRYGTELATAAFGADGRWPQ